MTYKVIQWATGGVGTEALRQVIKAHELELVGVFVYTDEKNGRDAGELAGVAPVGVLATTDRQEILALDADVVLHMPLGASMEALDEDVVALLRSGKNVISTAGYYDPSARGEAVLRRLTEACEAGNATLHGSGIAPGFVFDRLAPMITGVCSEVKHVRMVEYASCDHVPSAGLIHEAMGMGHPVDKITMQWPFWSYFGGYYSEVIANVARGLSVTLDEVTTGLDVEPATRDLSIMSGNIAEGTVAGTHHWISGSRDGKEFLRIELFWFVENGLPGFPVPDYNASWNVEIEGYPSSRVRFDLLPSLDPDIPAYDPIYPATAATPIRTIPEVCRAASGILHPFVFAAWAPSPPSH
jgi:hypothetical protein